VSFRRRVALAAAAAVAVAVVLASLLTYVLSAHQLRRQIDSQLTTRAANLRLSPSDASVIARQRLEKLLGPPATGTTPSKKVKPTAQNPISNSSPRPNQVRGYQEVVGAAGNIIFRSTPGVTLPVTARTRALAAGRGVRFFSEARVHGIDLRILSEHVSGDRVLDVAQSLSEVDSLLANLRLILALIDVGGIALAALLGLLVAGAAVRPLSRFTQATEHVTRTRDLSARIAPVGEDEIGRLADSFNEMLDALEESTDALATSVHAQKQLVADASHELRTPITSVRTNIEILQQRAADIDPAEQQLLLGDVVEQIEELTLLMNDLIDLARGEEHAVSDEDLRLDILITEVADRARRRGAGAPIEIDAEPTLIRGVPKRLERVVSNLLDNALKYGPGEPVEIALHGQELTVRDHGPGIKADDLPHIFDRFYRGADARGRPGSGLGLAIVRQVVLQLDGTIDAEAAPGGGTVMRMHLPGAEPADPDTGAPHPTRAGASAP
jgi:two-component system sensor histidine kinase MprB